MAITDAQGTPFEEGEAVRPEGPSPREGWWTYTTTEVPQNPTWRVVASAKDLPGNSEGLVWQYD